jgi:predicted aspartyl protease
MSTPKWSVCVPEAELPDDPARYQRLSTRWSRLARLAGGLAIMTGLLGGCTQQFTAQIAPYDPEREAHVESFCGGAGSLQGVEQCRQYYLGDPRLALPHEPMHVGTRPPAISQLTPSNFSPTTPLKAVLPASVRGGTEVTLVRHGGTLQVPVTINDAIKLDFVVDSGASEVSIPADVFRTLLRTGTLHESDLLGEQTYVLADGSRHVSERFRIRSLKVGDKVLTDVTGSIAPTEGSLLLGQSFLQRFRSWSIDNARGVLLLQ